MLKQKQKGRLGIELGIKVKQIRKEGIKLGINYIYNNR